MHAVQASLAPLTALRRASAAETAACEDVGFVAALLFAAHPVHSEVLSTLARCRALTLFSCQAVISMDGRAEMLCAAFYLLGFLFYTKAMSSGLYGVVLNPLPPVPADAGDHATSADCTATGSSAQSEAGTGAGAGTGTGATASPSCDNTTSDDQDSEDGTLADTVVPFLMALLWMSLASLCTWMAVLSSHTGTAITEMNR